MMTCEQISKVAIVMVVLITICCLFSFNKEMFTSEQTQLDTSKLYNPLYTSPDLREQGSYLYMQPPGDVEAQKYAGSGQGTSGEFLPLQGKGAGVFMKNSTRDNHTAGSPYSGMVGGYPNYTGRSYDSSWIGFNNFGLTDKSTDQSYLLQGANTRVANPGQPSNLPCPQWLPNVSKIGDVCTQNSDAIAATCGVSGKCPPSSIQRYVAWKNMPEWKKIMV